MLSLRNDELEVSILHPVADRDRLGSRYCTGGYVYLVADRRLGVLTSGPGYPDEEPPPLFDGQGLPEAFPSPLLAGMDLDAPSWQPAAGTPALVPGVGMVTMTARERIRTMPVDRFCDWTIAESPATVRMETRQSFAGWDFALRRELALLNRTLVSTTHLANVGRDPIPFRWFPHPFFPLVRGECCRVNLAVSLPENPGYELLPNGWIGTKPTADWHRVGHFQALRFEPGDRLVALQRHPKLGIVVATCSYTPGFFPIWGNRHTFSFEPYLEGTVKPGSEQTWSITYDF
jgi:hypothetical protein